EDGIRDRNVTGVQTCALPIFDPGGQPRRVRSGPALSVEAAIPEGGGRPFEDLDLVEEERVVAEERQPVARAGPGRLAREAAADRSEERRVGKGGRGRGRACA